MSGDFAIALLDSRCDNLVVDKRQEVYYIKTENDHQFATANGSHGG